jgi:hypothetical protein
MIGHQLDGDLVRVDRGRASVATRLAVMTIQKLEKPKWRPFLDVVSKLLEAKVAEIEVASLKLGD